MQMAERRNKLSRVDHTTWWAHSIIFNSHKGKRFKLSRYFSYLILAFVRDAGMYSRMHWKNASLIEASRIAVIFLVTVDGAERVERNVL